MSENQEQVKGIPENAFRELKEGEVFEPLMSPKKVYPEITPWSVVWGLVMAAVFSAAAAYLGLKIGQVFEAAIPIAIIAIALSTVFKRKNALGENVIIQSIGACSGVIVAGAIFTLPALYILQAKRPGIEVNFIQIFFSSLLGGFLGILFLIPFRKYFVADMHGKYPFPEATATTQVLVSGEKGGNQAKVLLIAGLIGGLYDFIIATFGAWSETVTSRIVGFGKTLASDYKLLFKTNTGAAVMGLGYIVGLKYAAIICAGSFIGWFVIIPIIAYFASGMTQPVGANITLTIAQMSPEQIFANYVRPIGIGGIAMAGMIGIWRSKGIILQAFGLAARELGGKGKDKNAEMLRTQKDISMKIIALGVLVLTILVFIFFQFGVVHNLKHAIIGLAIVMIIAFLFTTVAANAIAIVGSNPVSGMTLMTLIIASIIMVAAGLEGSAGMVAALVIGGVVCTALSTAGGFITDLKIGYWLGTSPYKQETWKFLGVLVSAATVGGVIMVLNKTYGFTGDNALVAPQANAMAAVIEPLMSGQSAPWMLYGAGAALALILTSIGVPALAFALGMFIPLDLNVPILIGGFINEIVITRSKDEKLNNARQEQGTLIASGFIAGGALMGVAAAIIKFAGFDFFEVCPIMEKWAKSDYSQWLAIVMFFLLCCYMVWHSLKAKVEE
ncbi:oligopeptide transporter, OPT family [bacterium]|nr:oligopeptide transporter, OPT family [bacterium]